ncbi:MAG: NADP oxidoreductase [Planctomycetes bacterium]|nr:NADP oxidoreductase [Planctomycetota bacterium]
MTQSAHPGTAERPLRAAIVGSGPSGFYAADALISRAGLNVTIDIIDRLPTPYGLVRGGVAPDHQNIKGVIRVYEKVMAHPGVRFFGNIKVGRDIQAADLRACYDAVVFAVGNESDQRMRLPGEDLPGCHSATEFVGWYNGHPDFTHLKFELDVEAAVVIGVGNVAMDVARILARDPHELAGTDMAGYALEELKTVRKLKRIYVVGRRGAAQAAFSPKEIKEIGALKNADLIVGPDEVAGMEGKDPAAEGWDVETKQDIEFLLKKAQEAPAGKPRQIVLRFLRSPVEFLAGPHGRLGAIKLEQNALVDDGKGDLKAQGTGQFETLPVGVAFKAIGYRGVPLPGVPYDVKKGIIPSAEGRVVENLENRKLVPGAYVVGWAKRGPSGLIGTNKGDSIATVEALLNDFAAGKTPPNLAADPRLEALPELLAQRGARWVSFEDWKRIDEEEIRRGKAAGKIREKFINIQEVLKFLDSTR